MRVAELLRQDIARVIYKEIKNPDIRLLTITKVVVSPDLKYAKIFLSVLGADKQRQKVMAALEKARTFIRYSVGNRSSLRFTPEFQFIYDDTLDYVENIENILNGLKSNTPDQVDS